MIFPKRPNPNDKLSADWGRQVVDCLHALPFLGGPGLITKESPSGTTASVVRQPCKGSAAVSPDDPTEWEVALSGSTASVLPRPVVLASRLIPAAWAADEETLYSNELWSAFHPEISVSLVNESGVGLGSGFVYAEIDLAQDTIVLGFSVARPVDDPSNSLVRIALVHVAQTATTVEEVTTYTFAIDAWLHRGAIHITALFAP